MEAVQERCLRARRKEKGGNLEEFTQVMGYHRKAAIRLPARSPRPSGGRRGRPRRIGPVVAPALKVLRVVDASVMPDVIRANTNGTTIMIAERVADWVKHDT